MSNNCKFCLKGFKCPFGHKTNGCISIENLNTSGSFVVATKSHKTAEISRNLWEPPIKLQRLKCKSKRKGFISYFPHELTNGDYVRRILNSLVKGIKDKLSDIVSEYNKEIHSDTISSEEILLNQITRCHDDKINHAMSSVLKKMLTEDVSNSQTFRIMWNTNVENDALYLCSVLSGNCEVCDSKTVHVSCTEAIRDHIQEMFADKLRVVRSQYLKPVNYILSNKKAICSLLYESGEGDGDTGDTGRLSASDVHIVNLLFDWSIDILRCFQDNGDIHSSPTDVDKKRQPSQCNATENIAKLVKLRQTYRLHCEFKEYRMSELLWGWEAQHLDNSDLDKQADDWDRYGVEDARGAILKPKNISFEETMKRCCTTLGHSHSHSHNGAGLVLTGDGRGVTATDHVMSQSTKHRLVDCLGAPCHHHNTASAFVIQTISGLYANFTISQLLQEGSNMRRLFVKAVTRENLAHTVLINRLFVLQREIRIHRMRIMNRINYDLAEATRLERIETMFADTILADGPATFDEEKQIFPSSDSKNHNHPDILHYYGVNRMNAIQTLCAHSDGLVKVLGIKSRALKHQGIFSGPEGASVCDDMITRLVEWRDTMWTEIERVSLYDGVGDTSRITTVHMLLTPAGNTCSAGNSAGNASAESMPETEKDLDMSSILLLCKDIASCSILRLLFYSRNMSLFKYICLNWFPAGTQSSPFSDMIDKCIKDLQILMEQHKPFMHQNKQYRKDVNAILKRGPMRTSESNATSGGISPLKKRQEASQDKNSARKKGIPAKQKTSEFTPPDSFSFIFCSIFKKCKLSCNDFKTSNFTVSEIRYVFSLSELKSSVFDIKELKQVYKDIEDFQLADFSLKQLKSVFNVEELMRCYDLSDLLKVYSVAELHVQGKVTFKDLKKNNISLKRLKREGFEVQDVFAHFTVPQLLECYTPGEICIPQTSYTVSTMKQNKVPITEIVKCSQFNIHDVYGIYSIEELKEVYSVKQLREVYSLMQLHYQGRFKLEDLSQVASMEEMVSEFGLAALRSIYSDDVLNENIAILMKVCSLDQIYQCNCFKVHLLLKAGVSPQLLTKPKYNKYSTGLYDLKWSCHKTYEIFGEG